MSLRARARARGRVFGVDALAPTPQPVLLLSDGTHTRGSEASYPTGPASFAWALANVLRKDATLGDDVVGDYLAATVLLENSATNLCTRSEELDDAIWQKNAATVVANDTVAPDGDSDADAVVGSIGGQQASVWQSCITSIGARYAWSVWLKKRGANTSASIEIFDGFAASRVNVVLTDTWTRYQVAQTVSNTATSVAVYAHADGFDGLLANADDDLCATACQFELVAPATVTTAPAASSYIRTGAVPVTRSADSLTFADAAIPAALRTGRAKFAVRLDWLASESTASRAIYSPSVNNVNRIRIAPTTGELQAIEQSVQRFAGPNLDAATRFEKSIVVVDLVAGRFEVDGTLGTAGTPFDFTAEGTTWRFGGAASTQLFGRMSNIYAG